VTSRPGHLRSRFGRKPLAVGVVQVDDRHLGHRTDAAGEEPSLHLEVGLERLVEIEMVPGQVGEHGGAEFEPEHALLRDAVRAHLHHRAAAAGVAHLGQHAEDVEGLGRRAEGGDGPRPEVVADRAEEADPLVCRSGNAGSGA
jgi:hypothetical protein